MDSFGPVKRANLADRLDRQALFLMYPSRKCVLDPLIGKWQPEGHAHILHFDSALLGLGRSLGPTSIAGFPEGKHLLSTKPITC